MANVAQAERIRDQYRAEREQKERELEDHNSYKNGQPENFDNIQAHIDKRHELERQLEEARQKEKAAEAQVQAEKEKERTLQKVELQNREEMERNGYHSSDYTGNEEIRPHSEWEAQRDRSYEARREELRRQMSGEKKNEINNFY